MVGRSGFFVTTGQVSDYTGLAALLNSLPKANGCGPTGYGADWFRIGIMFGRFKDWRQIATRHDRCPMAFFSALALDATVIFWLWSTSLTLGGDDTLYA